MRFAMPNSIHSSNIEVLETRIACLKKDKKSIALHFHHLSCQEKKDSIKEIDALISDCLDEINQIKHASAANLTYIPKLMRIRL